MECVLYYSKVCEKKSLNAKEKEGVHCIANQLQC